LIGGGCRGWGSGQGFFYAIHVKSAGVAALEAVENFAGFFYLSGLVVENA
jgi:hypothetical protein